MTKELTYDFKIEVETQYLSAQSDTDLCQFDFSYTISIHNLSEVSAQLISRHWFITDGNGQTKEVRGLGVIGKQPIIAPNKSYRYMSGLRLSTPFGTMHGAYQMLAENKRLFEIVVPVFRLAVPELVN